MTAERATTIARTCRVCGGQFHAARKPRGRLPNFCSDECRIAANVARRERYFSERRYVHSARCLVCGAEFETIYQRSRTCSQPCSNKLLGRNARKAHRAKRASGDLFESAERVAGDR